MIAVLLLASASAQAALNAYEPFGYSPAGADLNGRGAPPSFGFSSPWAPGGFNASVNTNYDLAGDSLSFGGLVTGGGRTTSLPTAAIAGLTRNLSAPLGAAGTTQYLSFLLRPEGTLHAGAFNGFFGLTLETPGEPELFVGKPGGGAIGNYVIEDRGGSGQSVSNFLATPNQTVLLVLKAEFNPGGAANDRFSLWVNPTPGGPEPGSFSTIKNNSNLGSVTGLTIYSTGAFSIDELRVGDTFADVTPVPEPGAALAAGAGFLMLLRPRRNPTAALS
jgi:hypothetical protein